MELLIWTAFFVLFLLLLQFVTCLRKGIYSCQITAWRQFKLFHILLFNQKLTSEKKSSLPYLTNINVACKEFRGKFVVSYLIFVSYFINHCCRHLPPVSVMVGEERASPLTAGFWPQMRATLIRNILRKKRNKKHTLRVRFM